MAEAAMFSYGIAIGIATIIAIVIGFTNVDELVSEIDIEPSLSSQVNLI